MLEVVTVLSLLAASSLTAVTYADVPPEDEDSDDGSCECGITNGPAERSDLAVALLLAGLVLAERRRAR